MGNARIGVYSICYKEAEWLGFNIRRMYDWVDRFSVCVGPIAKASGTERDKETLEALRALPDPDNKIHLAEGVWQNKNQMTCVAMTELRDFPLILQLDSDEVWPKQAFDEAVSMLRAGERKLMLHMYSFWKSPDYVMEIPDRYGWAGSELNVPREVLQAAGRSEPGAEEKVKKLLPRDPVRKKEIIDTLRMGFEGVERHLDGQDDAMTVRAYECCSYPWSPYLLDMHRAFRPCEHTHISHIPPDLVWPNGESAHWHAAGVVPTPLWHLCYVGDSRMARKFDFFNKRDGEGSMPKPEVFLDWTEAEIAEPFRMTGQLRRVTKYKGPPMPDDVREFAERMAA